MFGLQEMCWPCSLGCSLLSQHWPSCCTSISTAARTHGERWGDTGGQCLGAGWVQGMRTRLNEGFRQQDTLRGLTVPSSFFPHQAGLADQIQGHLHGSQHREHRVNSTPQPATPPPLTTTPSQRRPVLQHALAARAAHMDCLSGGQHLAPIDIFVIKKGKNY